jgi:hypothetical protein
VDSITGGGIVVAECGGESDGSEPANIAQTCTLASEVSELMWLITHLHGPALNIASVWEENGPKP